MLTWPLRISTSGSVQEVDVVAQQRNFLRYLGYRPDSCENML